jgi:hypothetical protein
MYWKASHIWTAEGMPFPATRSIIYLYGIAVRIALPAVLRRVCFVSGLANDRSKLKTRPSVGALCARVDGIMLVHCVPEHLALHSHSVWQNISLHIRAVCTRVGGNMLVHCVPEHLASHSHSVWQNIWPHILTLCARTFDLTFSLCVA